MRGTVSGATRLRRPYRAPGEIADDGRHYYHCGGGCGIDLRGPWREPHGGALELGSPE